MNTKNAIITAGGGIFIVIMILFAIASYTDNVQKSAETEKQNKEIAHAAYCKHWYDTNQERKAAIRAEMFPSESETAQLNAEISQYNKECYF